MVVITASHTVLPREPTPSNPVKLYASDKKQRFFISLIFVYKQEVENESMEFPIQKMKDSLSHILVYYYPFAGRFCRTEGDELQVDCNAKGALLLEANTELKLKEYGDFAPSKLLEDLVPAVDYRTPIDTWPLLLTQLTRFSCGGFCIGVTFCHSLVEAWSCFFFMNLWAKLFRGEALDKDEIPIFDRTILKPKFQVGRLYHDEFSAPPLILGRSDTEAEEKHETTSMVLHLTKTQVHMLKKKANEVSEQSETGHHTVRSYSTYEAITSHIWRSACKARQVGLDANQPTKVKIAASIRNRLKPPIAKNYAGNAIVITCAVCVFHDITSNPLSYTAQKVRESLDTVTEERIRSAMDAMDSLNSDGSDSPQLPRTESKKAYFYGNPNLVIGSLLNMGTYDADFGWGKPFYVGPTSLEFDGKTFIFPSYLGDGSVNVVLRLQTRHAESFKKYFFQEVIQESMSSSRKGKSNCEVFAPVDYKTNGVLISIFRRNKLSCVCRIVVSSLSCIFVRNYCLACVCVVVDLY